MHIKYDDTTALRLYVRFFGLCVYVMSFQSYSMSHADGRCVFKLCHLHDKNLSECIALSTVECIAAVTQLFSADNKVSATSSQGIRRYVSLMTPLKYTFLKLNNVLLNIIAELLDMAMRIFRMTVI